jgi:hypothetical protein
MLVLRSRATPRPTDRSKTATCQHIDTPNPNPVNSVLKNFLLFLFFCYIYNGYEATPSGLSVESGSKGPTFLTPYSEEFTFSTPAMKFLRDGWRRNTKPTKAPTSNLVEEALGSASYLHAPSSVEQSIQHKFVPPCARTRKPIIPMLYPKSPPRFRRDPRNPPSARLSALLHSPQNIGTTRAGLVSGANVNPPRRPPRPPSLNLPLSPVQPILQHTRKAPRSSIRVKFAYTPRTRLSHPNSSSRLSSHSKGNKPHRNDTSCRAPSSISEDFLDFNSSESSDSECEQPYTPDDHIRTVSEGHSINKRSKSPNSPSLITTPDVEHVIADLPQQDLHSLSHATTSTPHLPYIKGNTLRLKSEHSRDMSNPPFPSALFPPPSALALRKRPKPLILQPMPTGARFPPSPPLTSPNSAPPTPILPHAIAHCTVPQKSQRPISRKPAGTPHRNIPRPACKPPTGPLPSPPASPTRIVPSVAYTPQPHLTTQSTTDLLDRRFAGLKLSSTPRFATSNTTTSVLPLPNENHKGHANSTHSRPPATALDTVRLIHASQSHPLIYLCSL